MKKSILTIISLIGLSFCQIEHGGIPKFYNNRSLDINYLSIDQNEIIDRNFDPMVFEYGVEYDMNINVLESATVIYDNNTVTYLFGINSSGAYGIGINFDNFYLTSNTQIEWTFAVLKNYLPSGCNTVTVVGLINNNPFILNNDIEVCT